MAIRVFFSTILSCVLLFSYGQSIKKKAISTWISPVDFDLEINPENKPTGGCYYLLRERQLNLSLQEKYSRFIFKILSSEGVQEMSDLSVDFDPEFETLIFNSIILHRKGEKINKLLNAEIKVVQREQSMERYLYDGTKTAYINLTDVRAGDVIEYSYTLKGYNPVFKGNFSQFFYFDFAFPYQKLYQRVLIPKGKEIYFHYRNGEIKPEVSETSLHKEYTWTIENNKALIIDNNTPGWYDPYRYVALTSFRNWEEVKNWGVQQFTVTPEQINKVKSKLPAELLQGSQDDRLLKSIRFVQDEIRYLGFENGVYSHLPHAPEKVLDQRFGDCKDKSLLLVVLAHIQGFEAHPVLVNTSIQNKINEEPPTYYGFDHCITQLKYKGKEIYIDPTINNQGGLLESIYFPFYSKGLVISPHSQDLSDLSELNLYGTTEEQIFELTEIGKSAKMIVRTTYVGKDADSQRSEFSSIDLETTQKNYRTFYASSYPDIQVEKPIEISDDRDKNIFIVEEYYIIENFWKSKTDSEHKIYCELSPQSVDRLISVEKSTKRNAPYKLMYPLSFKHIIQIKLPEPWNAKNENVKIESDYYKFTNEVINNGLEIKIINEYQTKTTDVPVDFIENFVNDHERMSAELNYVLNYDTSLSSSDNSISFSYPLLIIFMAAVLGTVLVIRLNRFNPERQFDYTLPIGGWLILPAIGLCITPISIIYTLTNPENNFFNQSLWAGLLTNEQYGLFTLVVLELTYNIVLLFFSGLLILHFFQKRSSLPILILFLYGVTPVMTVIDAACTAYYTDEPFSHSLKDIIKNFLTAAIWIPYFVKSVRVKETFNVRL